MFYEKTLVVDNLVFNTMATTATTSEIKDDEIVVKPKNVSSHIWERFKKIEKQTNEITQRSKERRIKNLQRQVMDTVAQEFTSPVDKEILKDHDVVLTEETFDFNKKKKVKKCDNVNLPTIETSGLTKFMDINKHLKQTDFSKPPPPTALEKRLNEAVKEGNVREAEVLSDQLATREACERLVAAFDAKKYIEEKEVEEKRDKTVRKRKLDWGFESKQKWETKGNM